MLLATVMAACGGGGGSPGTTPGGVNPGGGPTAVPTITMQLVSSTGVATTTVGSLSPVFAKALVHDASGAAVAGAVVTFTSADGMARFIPTSGTALTDASGLATVQVLPATTSAAGAGVVNAAVTVGGKAATPAAVAFQVPQGADPATAKVANFVLLLDRSTLPNSGTTTAKLSVLAVDSNNNVAPGAAVTVSTDANSIFTPGASVTDAQGLYTGQIGVGGDKSDRQVVASVTVNGITKQTSLRVIGSKLLLQAVPPTPAPGQSVAVTMTLQDAVANPIPGATLTLGGTIPALQNRTVTTDLSGSATVSFVAPATAGSYTISATGSGVSSADYQLQVFTSTVTVAVIPVGAAPSLSASPNVLTVNAPNTNTSKSTLRFLFLDASNRPIPNVRVRFDDVTSGLPRVGASISSGTTTLYTDASGTVSAQYIAGQNSSPTNGVTVNACYSATDFASTNDCPAKISATLTVAGQALAVSIGDDNLMQKGTGTYIKRFAVTVADSAGRAVANAPVDISVDLTHFGKGFAKDTGGGLTDIPNPPSDPLAASPLDRTVTPTLIGPIFRVWCPNEDVDRNGNFDPGIDFNTGSVDSNGQPTLEPRKSDLIVSYDDPTVTATNSSGILIIKVEYSQRFATWLAYKVRVTANVSGSEGMAERLFVTHFIEGDEKNGSFLVPPYGQASCDSPN
jgi:hypothetical protein